MLTIINISAFHSFDVTKTHKAFSALYDQYDTNSIINSMSRCCGSTNFFAPYINYYRGQKHYAGLLESLLPRFQEQKIDAHHFLLDLLESFPFLKAIDANEFQLDALWSKRADLLSLKNVNSRIELSSIHFALYLLETAWNESLVLSDHHIERVEYLLENTSYNFIIVSNLDELHTNFILQQLRKLAPQISWRTDYDLSLKLRDELVQIHPRIRLCLPYHFKTNKTEDIIGKLTNNLAIPSNMLQLVSPRKN